MPKAEIIGLGRSGIAAANLLIGDGWQVAIIDSATETQLSSRFNADEFQLLKQRLVRDGIEVKFGSTITLEAIALPDLVVVSPGVPWDIPALIEVRKLGAETIGEIELAWRYLKAVPWVGITGTNGKTTTTAMVAAIFQAANLHAPACGNIGHAACELALSRQDSNNYNWIVAELSSYQIESSSQLAPKIGIWTTLTPDHLNRHKTLENYARIKASLLQRSRQQILNGDDRYLLTEAAEQFPDAYWTSIAGKDKLPCDRAKAVYIEDSWIVAFGELICPISLFKMSGQHNQQNLLMAVAAAKLAGIDKAAIARAITSFPGVAHRLESVGTHRGIEFINDSKATNYDAAEVGLAAVDAPAILIAGGEAKAGEDCAWLETIKAKASFVLLIGAAAPLFAQRLSDRGYDNYEIVETMENAVTKSLELALAYKAKVVLLSPACASFDRYQSFEHRGEHFRQLCQQLFT
ncbi:UDP-N-acetylmuramoyl-L-alanine--D-glutamate ligase [Myxosarcina sp. GI1]|uniref:UDP-N-acetylmuramoyl-L-alanine--D-glutamate ligase n=1 Tax=Myxosarcina sp. GI1 TaxID=1541065 RepID=UPI00056285A0|nr:UDP-N-acetylmuramoyl-L-alanine--D-glutamate ligase [Myxosarcina sp. GI1]